MRRTRPTDRGAAAVEYALLLPMLLLLVFGIVDFGRALNAQITLSQAAREGARLAALGVPDVTSRTQTAAQPLTGVTVTIDSACPPGSTADAVVRAQYSFSFVTPVVPLSALFGGGLSGGPITLTGRGTMRCAG